MNDDYQQGNVINLFRNSSSQGAPFATAYNGMPGRQLPLPFSELNRLVLVRDTEISQAEAFVDFLKNFKPRYLLDFRISPRLDFVASSRAVTLRIFSELDVEYIDLFGRIGVHSVTEFAELRAGLANAISSVIRESKATNRPLVCFFDDERLLEDCRGILPSAVKFLVAGGGEPNVSVYRAGLLAV